MQDDGLRGVEPRGGEADPAQHPAGRRACRARTRASAASRRRSPRPPPGGAPPRTRARGRAPAGAGGRLLLVGAGRQPDVRVQRLATGRGDDAVQQDAVVGQVGADHVAGVQQRAQLPVERGPGGQPRRARRRCTPVMSHSMPACPNRAVIVRSRGDAWRCVVCGPWRRRARRRARAAAAGRSSAGSAGARAGRCSRDAQTRSVRSRMPRSTRAPPRRARLDLQAGVPRPQLVEQPVDGERSARARRRGRRRRCARPRAGRGCGPT